MEEILDKITSLISEDEDKFYTNLAAHKSGFDTDYKEIISKYLLHKDIVKEHIFKQKPHLAKGFVKSEGKLDKFINHIPVVHNLDLYDDSVIRADLNSNNLHLYAQKFNILSDLTKEKFYLLIELSNISVVINNDLRIPVKYLKPNCTILYINYMANKPDFEDFLSQFDNSKYILQNYHHLKHPNITSYVMRYVTMITKESLENLINVGFTLRDILTHRPQFLPLSLDYINTIDDLKIVLKCVDTTTSVEVINHLYTKLPHFKTIIDERIKRLMNG